MKIWDSRFILKADRKLQLIPKKVITVDVVGSWCWKMQLTTDPLLKDAPQGISMEFPIFQINDSCCMNTIRT